MEIDISKKQDWKLRKATADMLWLTRSQRRLTALESQRVSGKTFGWCIFLAAVVFVCGCIVSRPAHAYTDKEAILAIIGEAEGESYLGKIAIAATILNRGHLKGVYGATSFRVRNHLYSAQTYQDAKRAWEYAKATHGEGEWDATGWGNAGDIQQFKRQGWFKNCVITAHVGNHYFYKEVRK